MHGTSRVTGTVELELAAKGSSGNGGGGGSSGAVGAAAVWVDRSAVTTARQASSAADFNASYERVGC